MLNKKFALKVKIKSLAAEARIIKQEIRKRRDVGTKNSLRIHHIEVVRREARHSHIAYAFLKGKEYCQVESKCAEPPNFKKVAELVERFGVTWDFLTPGSYSSFPMRETEQAQNFAAWKERAISHLNSSQKIQ